jgi:hypothetical protein
LFFTHDPEVAMCGLLRDDQGQVVARDSVSELRGEVA